MLSENFKRFQIVSWEVLRVVMWELMWELMWEFMGGLWERFGRDQKYLSRAATPLYKGFPRDLGRDERFLRLLLAQSEITSRHWRDYCSLQVPSKGTASFLTANSQFAYCLVGFLTRPILSSNTRHLFLSKCHSLTIFIGHYFANDWTLFARKWTLKIKKLVKYLEVSEKVPIFASSEMTIR